MQYNKSMVAFPTNRGLEMASEEEHQHCGVVPDRQSIHDKIANTAGCPIAPTIFLQFLREWLREE